MEPDADARLPQSMVSDRDERGDAKSDEVRRVDGLIV